METGKTVQKGVTLFPPRREGVRPQRPPRTQRGRSGGGEGEEFNTRVQRSEKIELRFRSGEWRNPLLSRTRTFTCTRPQGGAEGNSTQRHKGTKGTKFRGCLGFLGSLNPHYRFQRQHGTFPEAPLLSKLNGLLQGKFLFQKLCF